MVLKVIVYWVKKIGFKISKVNNNFSLKVLKGYINFTLNLMLQIQSMNISTLPFQVCYLLIVRARKQELHPMLQNDWAALLKVTSIDLLRLLQETL